MYQRVPGARAAGRLAETPPGLDPEDAARQALARVRTLLTAFTPEMSFDPARLRDSLAVALTAPDLEAERLFALGWLRWLEGDAVAAEPLLEEALRQARAAGLTARVPEVAYWHARVRILRGRDDAVSGFESVLRTAGGSPSATACFVDLLTRAGRVDRADQVWKSVRGNRRVLACDEGPLLEARALLRRGEAVPAERLLHEAAPSGGVAWVERLLLLAWTASARKQHDHARTLLRQAGAGPYPAAALHEWVMLLETRAPGGDIPATVHVPASLRDLVCGQEARQEGRTEEALGALRAALAHPAAQPFARYALACLGQDDPAALLAAQPGLFLAVRCRVRVALERFRRRAINPAEYLDAVQQAHAAGYQDTTTDHFRRLAEALRRRPDAVELHALAAELNTEPGPAGHNFFRAALELAVCCLPPPAALNFLREWACGSTRSLPEELRPLLGRQLLRLFFLDRAARDGADPRDAETLVAVESLLPQDALLPLARAVVSPAAEVGPASPGDDVPSLRLWEAARADDLAPGREAVRGLRASARWRPLAQALLFQTAARSGDREQAVALLDEIDAWRGFRIAPPRFVLRALRWLADTRPTQPSWRRTLARWLGLWDMAALDPDGAALAVEAGLAPLRGETAEPPPGVPVAAWLLHQAARALARNDAAEALAFTRRALVADPDLASVADAETVRAALPDLERRARACGLATLLSGEAGSSGAPGLLADAVELLDPVPEGKALLDAAASGDRAAAGPLLDALAARSDLPPRLSHHLALLEQRAAEALEDRGETPAALANFGRAWQHWLRFLAAPAGPAEEARGLLLDHLLALHRGRVNDLLARGAVDRARQHWNLVQSLPARAAGGSEALGRELANRAARFREELATEYLLATREAMRYGTIPAGWRADYARGLDGLRRLLSLDRDNVRLLTAVVEVCGEWFLDLYDAEDAPQLREQLDRYKPFALQLARLIEDRPGDLAARAVLSDFYKFRGFLADDRTRQIALYREALRFNPANDNVRDLLADLDEPPGSTPWEWKEE